MPLASLNDTDLVVGAILDVLELQLAGGIEPIERLVRYLAERQMLLVLDNLEQLSDVGPVAGATSRRCSCLEDIGDVSSAPLGSGENVSPGSAIGGPR